MRRGFGKMLERSTSISCRALEIAVSCRTWFMRAVLGSEVEVWEELRTSMAGREGGRGEKCFCLGLKEMDGMVGGSNS